MFMLRSTEVLRLPADSAMKVPPPCASSRPAWRSSAGPGDRGQVHAHLLGQVALRRQPVARTQHAVIHCLAHLLGDLQVQRASALAEGANPGAIGVFQAAAGGRWRHRSVFPYVQMHKSIQ